MYQPLDVSINRPFKSLLRHYWEEYTIIQNEAGIDKIKPPTKQNIDEWVLEANQMLVLAALWCERLQREQTNLADSNAVRVLTKSGIMLGHVEKKVAGFVAHIMDASLPGLVIKAQVL